MLSKRRSCTSRTIMLAMTSPTPSKTPGASPPSWNDTVLTERRTRSPEESGPLRLPSKSAQQRATTLNGFWSSAIPWTALSAARGRSLGRRTLPPRRFFQASFPDLPQGLRPRYDLVIAAESLYYIADVQAGIDRMNELGRFCLVTFHEGNSDQLREVFEHIPGVTFECIEHPVCNWNLYIWESTKASLPT